MRKALGWGVFGVGLVGLGLWGRGDHARDMEAEIRALAEPLVAGAVHAPEVTVSGRDITLTGFAESEAERDALVARMQEVKGRRVVRDALTVLPVAEPYTLNGTLLDKAISLSGAMPTQTSITALATSGVGAVGLSLANGEPEGWTMAVDDSVEALGALETGTLTMSGTEVNITGMALSPATRQAALAAAADLPAGFTFTHSIDVLDDGEPFALDLARDGQVVSGTGKLPAGRMPSEIIDAVGGELAGAIAIGGVGEGDPFGDMAVAGATGLAVLELGTLKLTPEGGQLVGTARTPVEKAAAEAAIAGFPITPQIGTLDDGAPFVLTAQKDAGAITGAGKLPAGLRLAGIDGDLETSSLGTGDPFAEAAPEGLAALRLLEQGTLSVENQTVTLRGVARTPAVVTAAEAALADLPAGYTTDVALSTLDDGTPFTLDATLEGGAVTGSGKLPKDLVLPQVGGDFEIAAIDARNRFNGAASGGLDALRLLESGTLSVREGLVRISGNASDPDVGAAVEAALADLPEGWSGAADLTLLDDGRPIGYRIVYNAATGAVLSGKVPRGLDADAVSDALGFDEVASRDVITARTGGDPAPTLELLRDVSDALPIIEGFEVEGSANAAEGTATAAGGVPVELLQDRLPGWAITAASDTPVDGAERVNLLTGQREVFRSVSWVPLFEFDASTLTCNLRSSDVLKEARVNFLSGSANLDAASVAVINQLTGIAIRCAQSDLKLEVGGHTDSEGSEAGNQRLSEARARAVSEALVARGVPADIIVAKGFGETNPIATNETAEGRAINRRTTFSWTN